MENDITKKSSTMLVNSNTFIEKLRKYAELTKIDFDDYQKICVANAIRSIDPMLASSNLTWNDLDVNNVFNVLQQVAFLKLNPSANEIAFMTRNQKRGEKWIKVLESVIMSNGNDTILRNFGQDVVDFKSYEVYDGDEFSGMQMDGWETLLPKYTPKYKSKKVLYSVYLIKKSNGEIEVSIAEREDAKISLLANARTNMGKNIDEALLRELNNHTLDELLSDPKWLNFKIKENNNAPLFSPAWTSSISSEKMISRKLRNHAIRRYPKNFNTTEIAELYQQTFEDEKYIKQNVIEAVDNLEIEEQTFKEEANKKPLKKESTGEKLVIKQEEEIVEEAEIEEHFDEQVEDVKEMVAEDDEVEDEQVEDIVEEEEVVEEKPSNKVAIPNKNDVEDWM